MSYSLPLAELLNVFAIDTTVSERVTSIVLDSREVTEGSVFFASNGNKSDGRDYMLAAQNAGALAIVYEAKDAQLPKGLTIPVYPVHGLAAMVGYAASVFYKEPSTELQVFGVTGTNGKTSCCYLLVQALTELGMNAAMIGTIGVGHTHELAASGLTTPDPISVQRILADFRDQGVTQVAMEVSSHALDQGRINGVTFFCTLFTNLSRDHLDYHGDMAQYGLAKQRLFTDFHSELIITNAADELGARLIDIAKADFIVQYGSGGDVVADEVTLGPNGITLFIEANGVEFELTTPLIGRVNVPNIELLVATLLALSTSVDDIQRIVSRLKHAPGRMEAYLYQHKPNVVVDYAHTPDALEKALQSVDEHCSGDLWCVFGCGGDRDKGKRPQMGKVAISIADKVVITNDNPRSEPAKSIADNILMGITSTKPSSNEVPSKYEVILSRAEAIEYAIAHAQPNDWVLVAGKGHEETQIIGDETLTFSDSKQVSLSLGVPMNNHTEQAS